MVKWALEECYMQKQKYLNIEFFILHLKIVCYVTFVGARIFHNIGVLLLKRRGNNNNRI